MPTVTIVTCTRDPHPDLLRRVLVAVEALRVPEGWAREYLLVDSASAHPLAGRAEERLFVARENRQFVVAPGYVGPDRRFKNVGPPAGTDGRRSDDLTAEVPDAAEPNMSQDELDAMFKPMKVMI